MIRKSTALIEISVEGLLGTFLYFTLPALIFLLILLFYRDRRVFLRIFKVDKKTVFTLPLLLLGLSISLGIWFFFSKFLHEPRPDILISKTPLLLCILIFTSLAAVFLEELFFRFWLLDFLERKGVHQVLAIFISSLIFGFAHITQGISALIHAFFAGIILAVGAKKTGSLSAPLLAHAIFNGAIFWISLRPI